MSLENYYSDQCGECHEYVYPIIKHIGSCIELNYTCKCGHKWTLKKWINQ